MQKLKLTALLSFLLATQLIYADDTIPEEKTSEEVALTDDSIYTGKPNSLDQIEQPLQKIEIPYKSPLIATGLSFLTPGLGSIYLGDYQTGGAILGSTLVGIGTDAFIENLALTSNTWFYGIYAAYRDVRIYNKSNGYAYPMPTDSFSDLAKAPFRWRVLKKPEVWGGLIGMLTIGGLVSYYTSPNTKITRCETSASEIHPLASFPVGIGEETFFRGYLQPLLSESFTPIGGIILSSIAFGAAHFQNADELEPEDKWRYYAYAMPYITAIGGYFGWVTYKNNSLQQSVAIHSWYDFIILSTAFFAPDASLSKNAKFALSFSF